MSVFRAPCSDRRGFCFDGTYLFSLRSLHPPTVRQDFLFISDHLRSPGIRSHIKNPTQTRLCDTHSNNQLLWLGRLEMHPRSVPLSSPPKIDNFGLRCLICVCVPDTLCWYSTTQNLRRASTALCQGSNNSAISSHPWVSPSLIINNARRMFFSPFNRYTKHVSNTRGTTTHKHFQTQILLDIIKKT